MKNITYTQRCYKIIAPKDFDLEDNLNRILKDIYPGPYLIQEINTEGLYGGHTNKVKNYLFYHKRHAEQMCLLLTNEPGYLSIKEIALVIQAEEV